MDQAVRWGVTVDCSGSPTRAPFWALAGSDHVAKADTGGNDLCVV